jgi:hypothetical protein
MYHTRRAGPEGGSCCCTPWVALVPSVRVGEGLNQNAERIVACTRPGMVIGERLVLL